MKRVVKIAPQLLGAVAVAMGLGCGARPAPNGAIRNAVDSSVEWAPANVIGGKEHDEIPIRGGEIVRITTDAKSAVMIGERVKNGTGFAESWRKVEPKDGALIVRGTLLGTAILVPKGTAARAHIARAHDPGYAWFELEAHVLAWAEGPLPAPFPAVAPPERLDFQTLATLDRVLAEAVAKAKDKSRARAEATAIRRVVGLRALRGLRVPPGFPYFYDHPLHPEGDTKPKEREFSDHKAWLVTTADPMVVTIEGPRMMQIWSHGVRRDDDETVKLRVVEGDRERAVSFSPIPHGRGARDQSLEVPVETAAVVPLRRATVHVPPGKHTYKIEAHGGNAFVAATASEPVVHLGDAMSGVKDEDRQLATALKACGSSLGGSDDALCAIAMALAGRDDNKSSAYRAAPPEAKSIADELAAGGPRDPSIALELAAANGDEKALAALGSAALRLVDDGIRAAWLRGTTRGTRWVVAESKDLNDKRWLSLLFDKTDQHHCAAAADEPWTELGNEEISFTTTTWRGAPTVELMAAVACSAKGPVKLDIDGQSLAPNPSSPLAKWHVLVKGQTARVRRADAGDGHVYAIKPGAASCGAHWGFIGAPRVASQSPTLGFVKTVTAPGLEVWLRDGNKSSKIDVISVTDPALRATINVTPRTGFVAVDGDGHRWVRVARVGLPPWASEGATVHGADDIAVRAVVRAPKGNDDGAGQAFTSVTAESESPREAEPLDEAKLIALTRQLLVAEADAKGKKYLERAMMLAVSGEARAAIEDARAAKVLGIKGPTGEDPIQLIKTSIRPKPRKPLMLPEGVRAYGVEPDFDGGAPRCGPSQGPRGKLASIVDELKTRHVAEGSAKSTVWDPQLAIRAFEVVNQNAMDPRGPSILSLAMAGSRWEVPKAIEGFTKVQRRHSSPKDGAIDPDGDLRARVGTGQPFDRSSYATVTESRPAKAGLTGTGTAKARVEFACVPRSPAEVETKDARCPIAIRVGNAAVIKPTHGKDGRGSVELPNLPPKGAQSQIVIALEPAPGRWAAIARVVFDQEIPGTTKVDGVGYVLMPPGLQWRWLVKDTQEITKSYDGPAIVRVDALAEPDESAKVVVIVDGKQVPVTLDGTPVMVPVPKGGLVKVKATGGMTTIGFAERVAKSNVTETAMEEAEPEPAGAEAKDDAEPTAVTSTALLDAGDPNALWRDAVSKSDRPLTPLEAALGTLSVHGLARTGTLRDGDPSSDALDSYFEQSLGYRRRIESLGVWTGMSASMREHTQLSTSFGASAFAWTHIDPIRLRLAAYGDVFGQNIHGVDARTARPHAYIEYSGRVTPSFYLLPRVGYDGYYTNVDSAPRSLVGVDDDVFNNFRFRRPTMLYQQITAWWVPYINDILFLRARVNEDAQRGLSHAGVRPGGLFAFGNLELGTYADATWFARTDGLRSTSKVDVTGVGYALYNLWVSNGSLDIQPGLGGRARAGDGGWEVYALVNVFASFRRGLRDFASPELSFPEQFGSNVPWRGPAVGGTR
jgi:hypothetical protein